MHAVVSGNNTRSCTPTFRVVDSSTFTIANDPNTKATQPTAPDGICTRLSIVTVDLQIRYGRYRSLTFNGQSTAQPSFLYVCSIHSGQSTGARLQAAVHSCCGRISASQSSTQPWLCFGSIKVAPLALAHVAGHFIVKEYSGNRLSVHTCGPWSCTKELHVQVASAQACLLVGQSICLTIMANIDNEDDEVFDICNFDLNQTPRCSVK